MQPLAWKKGSLSVFLRLARSAPAKTINSICGERFRAERKVFSRRDRAPPTQEQAVGDARRQRRACGRPAANSSCGVA